MKAALLVGTRPNFMKIAPVLEVLKEREVECCLIHTGQHYDPALSDAFFEDLRIPYPDHFLNVGSGSHAAQTARVMTALEPVLLSEKPTLLVVPGDVNSTAAGALTAVKLNLPVAHLESGLRSNDRTMPEEHNRVVADHLSELLLTSSPDANENLAKEGIPNERVVLVGNTMIDSLMNHRERAAELDVASSELATTNYLLVTLHRPALVDEITRLIPVMDELEEVALTRSVIFPIHPRTQKQLDAAGWEPKNLIILPPQSYLRFLSLQMSASAILTDSGGVQEESSVLGVPCFTLRDNTERPITVTQGTNTVLGLDMASLRASRAILISSQRTDKNHIDEWDGRAAGRVVDALIDRFG